MANRWATRLWRAGFDGVDARQARVGVCRVGAASRVCQNRGVPVDPTRGRARFRQSRAGAVRRVF